MTRPTSEKRAAFRALHADGCFILPNPWDVGSARLLQNMGFVALASTSSGYAWTIGQPDNAVTKETVLAHLKNLCAATDLPVNADYESGFATEPDAVADNVRLAIATGVAGLSIEDRKVEGEGLYDTPLAIERIAAARAAIDASGADVVLVARTEGLLSDPRAVTTAIDKLVAFAAAGADCLYAPGVRAPADIAAMVRAVAPKPLNVLVMQPEMTLAAFADLGVRRLSVGGALARVGWGAVIAAAKQMQMGSFEAFTQAASGAMLNETFDKFA